MIKSAAWIVVALFLSSLGYIAYHGAGTLSPSFLSTFPEKMMEEGGILPCIIGTAILSVGAMAVALPLGIACAVWLNEYAKEGPLKKLITLAVANLAGVPSIVFGLFGLAFFVTVCGLGVSAVAGILTLAVLTLPIVINTVRETLSQIPNSWRESSLALGASKTQTVLRTVLPAALPGILTGAILGLARAAGETSAIMFTAAVVSTTNLPNSPFAAVMSLPYHIYVLATTGMNPDKAVPIQCATALVLLMTVFALNLIAFYIRQKSSKRPA
ncbi:phosphate ABC transporter permease PstA [Parasutterella excrementihominis]|uniref:phosphate ABC transporter permease PstA n=1 Tax=Parasutterella excrementihominis TaxID=487175 RepID=UPI003A92F06B